MTFTIGINIPWALALINPDETHRPAADEVKKLIESNNP